MFDDLEIIPFGGGDDVSPTCLGTIGSSEVSEEETEEEDFKVGDRVVALGLVDDLDLTGKTGTVVTKLPSNIGSNIGVEFDEEFKEGHNLYKKCKQGYGRWCKRKEIKLLTTNKNKEMKSIVNFVKNIALSANERLLRKTGLKDECGDFTCTAKDLVINKLVSENEPYLIEIATKLVEEQKKDKNCTDCGTCK